MSNTSFNKRVFGCVIIKSINSNYNADFSHQPRTLPNGTVYATDKALKYTVRNYFVKVYSNLTKPNSELVKENKETVFFFQRPRYDGQDIKVHSMDTNYELLFGAKAVKGQKLAILTNLMKCIDIRLFGATFTGAANVSLHGTVQITHGINRFGENHIYTEQIKAPQNPDLTADMTTLGTQSKLQEGHYVHHFSINPKNIEEDAKSVKSEGITTEDITKLKEGFRRGASYYDSSSKAGTENELLFWVQLTEGSKAVLPSLVEWVDVNEKKEIDLQKIKALLAKPHISSEIEKIELYYNPINTTVINMPDNAIVLEL
jgi:CRISPR-associated protein Csh2